MSPSLEGGSERLGGSRGVSEGSRPRRCHGNCPQPRWRRRARRRPTIVRMRKAALTSARCSAVPEAAAGAGVSGSGWWRRRGGGGAGLGRSERGGAAAGTDRPPPRRPPRDPPALSGPSRPRRAPGRRSHRGWGKGNGLGVGGGWGGIGGRSLTREAAPIPGVAPPGVTLPRPFPGCDPSPGQRRWDPPGNSPRPPWDLPAVTQPPAPPHPPGSLPGHRLCDFPLEPLALVTSLGSPPPTPAGYRHPRDPPESASSPPPPALGPPPESRSPGTPLLPQGQPLFQEFPPRVPSCPGTPPYYPRGCPCSPPSPRGPSIWAPL